MTRLNKPVSSGKKGQGKQVFEYKWCKKIGIYHWFKQFSIFKQFTKALNVNVCCFDKLLLPYLHHEKNTIQLNYVRTTKNKLVLSALSDNKQEENKENKKISLEHNAFFNKTL